MLGRERGYHGVGFGGISVGGMVANRKAWPTAMIPGVDHLVHTHDIKRNAFTRGLPAHGAELADDLERLVALHDASTIAAVIVEPIAGSTGVVLPPQGYLKRLREICDKHGILLIFDEVITGFGRTGAAFAAQEFGVTPDMITCAKGLTNGCVPMGAVLASKKIYDAFMQGAAERHRAVPRLHLLGASDCLRRGPRDARYLSARGTAHTREADGSGVREGGARAARICRTSSTSATTASWRGSSCSQSPAPPGARAFGVFLKCFERGLLIRTTGDTIALSPALIIEPKHIEELFGVLSQALRDSA